MLDKAQEDMIQSICFGLKKIKNKSKVLIILQLITDVYLFSSLLMELISSFYALPFITLIVIIVKAVLTSMKRDTVSCAICSALNLSAFAMAFAFKIIDYNTAIINLIIYGITYFFVNIIFFSIKLKIFVFILICFPCFLISILSENRESIISVIRYFIKYLKSTKIYLYK